MLTQYHFFETITGYDISTKYYVEIAFGITGVSRSIASLINSYRSRDNIAD